MRQVTFILTDLYPDSALGGEPIEPLPRLASLETALTRGAGRETGDWRAWVCRRMGFPASARIPVAAIARYARSPAAAAPAGGQWWLAQCVHLEAGIDRVYLSAPSPELSDGEWRELERGFNDSFTAAGFRLLDGAGARAYAWSASELEADTIDPARVLGSDLLRAMPTGPGASVLKQLMTEIQMWLHDHPVNIAREERGAATVNALWIWGGGRCVGRKPSKAPLPTLWSDDAFLCGLWRISGAADERLPRSLDAIDLAQHDAMIVSLASAPVTGETPGRALMNLEGAWFAPAIAALRRRQVSHLQIHINDRLFVCSRSDLWRWWRARRPWFEGRA